MGQAAPSACPICFWTRSDRRRFLFLSQYHVPVRIKSPTFDLPFAHDPRPQCSPSDSLRQRDRASMMCHRIHFVVVAAAGLIACATTQTTSLAQEKPAVVELAVEPMIAHLAHRDDFVQLLVTAKRDDGRLVDVTRVAQYASAQRGITQATLGQLVPQGNGSTIVKIAYVDPISNATFHASINVEVKQFDEPRPLNFANDIVPVLSRYGCNSGGCHGKAIGQNGFKLSLYGFDPDADYAAIAHEAHGRRVSPAAPDDSLLLRKPTGALPHGGGVRFAADSEPYRLMRRWLEQGLPAGSDTAPRDVKLEVFPSERVVWGEGEQQFRALAHYSDGSTRDVTRIARYDSQVNEVFTVSSEGLGKATGRPGEGAILVRFADQVASARIVALRGSPLPNDAYAAFQPKNFIDELTLAKWRKTHVAPSPEASDAEFLRRVFLDGLGTLPSPAEVREFLADEAADKRDRLVERVLGREEFIDLWAHRLGDLLRNRVGDSNAKDNTVAFHKWIRQAIADNKPYDQFVREILTVTGTRKEHPQMDWFRWATTNENRVEDTAQAFLGLRVSCANCHNHPFENIRQADYWHFAAFFARIKLVGDGSINEIKVVDSGSIKHPRTEEALGPKAFGGPLVAVAKGDDPRRQLVDWMTAPDNPYFARALCNRVWGHFMGVGLVDPVDDMRASNPPSNPQLLDALARDFVEHKFDLKHLIKTIMSSRVYGLSSAPTADNEADKRGYARYYARRLAPHVLLDAVSSATGVPSSFKEYPDVKRAIQLPNEKVNNDFLDIFGRSERITPCECETSLSPKLPQVLFLLNSDEIQRRLTDKNGFVAELMKPGKSSEEIVDEMFLRTVSRPPRTAERQKAAALIEGATNRRQAIEDLLWALLNANEFLFNH